MVKKNTSFRDGELIKHGAIKLAEAVGENTFVRKFRIISLSYQTIAKRKSDLAEHVSLKVENLIRNCIYCSLSLDGVCL